MILPMKSKFDPSLSESSESHSSSVFFSKIFLRAFVLEASLGSGMGRRFFFFFFLSSWKDKRDLYHSRLMTVRQP